MAGTIIVDRIESDASYTSTINVAGQITFSNTVNFGVFAGTAPVSGFYLPTTNNLAFTTASTERMRINSSGNVGIGTSSPTAKLDVSGTAKATNMSLNGVAIGDYNLYSGMVTRVSNGGGVGINSANSSDNAYIYFGSGTSSAAQQSAAIGRIGGDVLVMFTAGSERMRIDSSGNVGIGTSSPTNGKLVISGNSVTTAQGIQLTGDTADARFICESATIGAGILGTFSNHSQLFYTNSAERMRIDSSGLLLIGLTSGNADAKVSINAGSTDSSPCIDFRKGSATTTTSQVFARFWASGGSVATGSITSNGVSVATFTGYSDRRLKENIVNLPSQLANIMALRPVEFDFKGYENGEGHQIGFIAQEVQEIYPDLVGEGDDGMLTLSDMNKNDARLIKAIQELKALVDTQASTITTLTARITALESN